MVDEKIVKYNGLNIGLHPEVYEPAEDTFLMLESIDIRPDDRVFEIGSGTGVIALECMCLGANVVCSDINPFAVDLIKKNYEMNKEIISINLDVRQGDLFSVLKTNEVFDVILFNPPYLPTSSDELVGGSGWFDKAVAGGLSGLEITERFIEEIGIYLETGGIGFFIYSTLSDREMLHEQLEKNCISYGIVNSIDFEDESLDVYCIWF